MFSLQKYNKTSFLFTGLIATIVFILIILVLPKIEKFNAKIVYSQNIATEIHVFSDLDSDGVSERIRFDKDFLGTPAFIVEKQGKIVYQHNFTGKFAKDHFYLFGDYNNDLLKEI